MQILKKLLSTRYLSKWTVLLMDLIIVVVSCVLAYTTRYRLFDLVDDFSWYHSIVFAVIFNAIMFILFRTYDNVLRLSSFIDLLRIFVSLTIGYGLFSVSMLTVDGFLGLMPTKIGIILTAYVINLVLMSLVRILVKLTFDSLKLKVNGTGVTNVMIYGAKTAGVNIAKSIRVMPENTYKVKGFIADEPELIGKVLMGVDVYANDEHLIETLRAKRVNTIIVSPVKMDQLKNTDFADRMIHEGIKLLAAPQLSEWNGKNLTAGEIKEIKLLKQDFRLVDLCCL